MFSFSTFQIWLLDYLSAWNRNMIELRVLSLAKIVCNVNMDVLYEKWEKWIIPLLFWAILTTNYCSCFWWKRKQQYKNHKFLLSLHHSVSILVCLSFKVEICCFILYLCTIIVLQYNDYMPTQLQIHTTHSTHFMREIEKDKSKSAPHTQNYPNANIHATKVDSWNSCVDGKMWLFPPGVCDKHSTIIGPLLLFLFNIQHKIKYQHELSPLKFAKTNKQNCNNSCNYIWNNALQNEWTKNCIYMVKMFKSTAHYTKNSTVIALQPRTETSRTTVRLLQKWKKKNISKSICFYYIRHDKINIH